MLLLKRKIGESIVINSSIEVEVVEIHGKTVKLGLVYTKGDQVLRKELYEKLREENILALQGTVGATPKKAGDSRDG